MCCHIKGLWRRAKGSLVAKGLIGDWVCEQAYVHSVRKGLRRIDGEATKRTKVQMASSISGNAARVGWLLLGVLTNCYRYSSADEMELDEQLVSN
ncbi:hypothetical protein M440DRAFT_1160661 [Trichoderma longibrachiatum ATCC 18648]|uniref:Uncharacterized protein n=1 Tax=Trichoderma longibrachiatum ATCC 18648 TaxID=983965 RepID=A0A2T4CC64_TRILO|nr:hypothetical protein M440DRAFT_1160661 [Trichoderma longibrachiatum ATCC 18648]